MQQDNKPPVMGSWRNMYILVLSTLFFLILIFALITYNYS